MAGSGIKGITVEIGGDCTALDEQCRPLHDTRKNQF
jgi:hypothetical protein